MRSRFVQTLKPVTSLRRILGGRAKTTVPAVNCSIHSSESVACVTRITPQNGCIDCALIKLSCGGTAAPHDKSLPPPEPRAAWPPGVAGHGNTPTTPERSPPDSGEGTGPKTGVGVSPRRREGWAMKAVRDNQTKPNPSPRQQNFGGGCPTCIAKQPPRPLAMSDEWANRAPSGEMRLEEVDPRRVVLPAVAAIARPDEARGVV